MPKDPPTDPVSTRTFSTGTPSTSLSRLRMPNTPWQPSRSTNRPDVASNSASAERGSIAETTMRLLRIDNFVTCAAAAKAALTFSVSP